MVKKSTYTTLPNAQKKIQAVMQELGIRPLRQRETIQHSIEQKKRFYMLPVHYRGGVAWFKASLEDAPGLSKSLQHEIQIQRAFGDFERRYHPRFDSPSFLAAGGTSTFRWLLRKYWVGQFAGDMLSVFGYRPHVLDTISPQRFANVFEDVVSMSSFMRKRLQIYHHDVSWYLLDFRHYREHFFNPVLTTKLNPGWKSSDFRRFETTFKQARNFLKHGTSFFSHGDLYPNNVMLVGKKPSIVLFDWELANWNVQSFDSVMVYLLAWRRPVWQKHFRAASLRWLGGAAGTDWYLAQLSLATRFAGFAFARLMQSQPDRYEPLAARDKKIVTQMYNHMVTKITEADVFLNSGS